MRTAQRIEPKFVERVWGRRNLAPFWGDQERPVGEVWFELAEDYPLLVKFIFTDERLSLQVHPDDNYAQRVEKSRGKTEMWHILAAEPGATIALGFKQPVTREEVRARIDDGSLGQLVNLEAVQAGDTLYAEARTVHAIGAGITLCEIQQNSDVTYRLYDYGRPRELHVEKGLEVLNLGTYDGRRDLPVRSPFFTTELLPVNEDTDLNENAEHLLICIEGQGRIGPDRYEAGELWHVPAADESLRVRPEAPSCFLRAQP